jgi:hypothetical protein
MRGILSPEQAQRTFGADPLAAGLRDELSQGFVVEQGCTFLSASRAKTLSVKLTQLGDRTGMECFVNHVHLGDVCVGASAEEQLLEAIRFAGAIDRLAEETPRRFIVSLSDDECVVRFHQRREGESWISDDLERYPDEAIIVLDTP